MKDDFDKVEFIAVPDVGFKQNFTTAKTAVVILKFPELRIVDHITAKLPPTFPYIPGFLSFREIPVIFEALKKLTLTPDLIFVMAKALLILLI